VSEPHAATLDKYEMDVVTSLHAFSTQSTDAGRATTILAIDAYVDVMRDAQFTPERVVIAIKRAVRRAGALPSADVASRSEGHAWELMTEQVVTRAIRRYFQLPSPASRNPARLPCRRTCRIDDPGRHRSITHDELKMTSLNQHELPSDDGRDRSARAPRSANRVAPPRQPLELSLLSLAFAPRLREDDLLQLLEFLNGLSDHRFTGVYQFEPGWVVSVALFDRENPSLRLGADVKMKESYCWLAGLDGTGLTIEDATCDPRLDGHAARQEVRSYIAVLLHDRARAPWGTLCHFDFAPRCARPEAVEQLESFRPLVEEMFIRDKLARWEPEAPSRPRHRLTPD
jgi:hypothetical protein